MSTTSRLRERRWKSGVAISAQIKKKATYILLTFRKLEQTSVVHMHDKGAEGVTTWFEKETNPTASALGEGVSGETNSLHELEAWVWRL